LFILLLSVASFKISGTRFKKFDLASAKYLFY
jgi:hypothetical protein